MTVMHAAGRQGAPTRRGSRFFSLGVVILAIQCGAWVCSREQTAGSDDPDAAATALARGFSLDRAAATTDIQKMTESPHPFGSARQVVVGDHLAERLRSGGANVVMESFTARVPNPAAAGATGPVATTLERQGRNIHVPSTFHPEGKCVVLLGSHYDTKELAGVAYVGANDSGSSTIALVQIVHYLLRARGKAPATACDIAAVLFDGEEAVLPNWNDGLSHPAKMQDNTYGSRHTASRLNACTWEGRPARCLPPDLGGRPVAAVIIIDMIGSPHVRITRDENSSASLGKLLVESAGALGLTGILGRSTRVEDDHIPFLEAGIPALDIIDFENLSYWHRAGDDAVNLSYDNIELVSRLSIRVLLAAARDPKVL